MRTGADDGFDVVLAQEVEVLSRIL